MSRFRRLAIPLLIGQLLLPTATTLAQDGPLDGWVVSDDGLVFATNDSYGTPLGWTPLPPDAFPPAVAAIPAPDVLYRIDDTLDSGTRIAGLHDGTALSWLDEGRTPVLAKAVVDDEGATWTRLQHVISVPAGCSDTAAEMDSCVHPWLIASLADQAAPAGSPVAPPPFAGDLEPGYFASTGVTDRDGTLFSFAGGATVDTTVRVRNDDTIVVRGNVDIGDGLGGQLRGFDATIVPIAADGLDFVEPPGWGPLDQRARSVRQVWTRNGKALRTNLACPPSRRGYVVSQFLIGGAGQNVGPTVDVGLEGGVPVLVSEVIPFDCGQAAGPGPAVNLPIDSPAAALVCASTRARHAPFTSTQDGQTVTDPSSLDELFAIVTIGLPSDTAANLNTRIAGANGGHFFSVRLEGVQLDSATYPDATLWLGEARAGIDSYGPKRFRDLELTAGSATFDLIEHKRELLGEAFEVGPSQKPVTNCPDFDFSFNDMPEVFADGFESGDVSAWSNTRAD